MSSAENDHGDKVEVNQSSSGTNQPNDTERNSSSGSDEYCGPEVSEDDVRNAVLAFEKFSLEFDMSCSTVENLKAMLLEGFGDVVDYIKEGRCKNIITFAGAGISTSSGIPDFSSPHNLEKFNLPHPQAIFELDFFKENPRPLYQFVKEIHSRSFKPTVCHYFVRLLHEKRLLLRHFTQNIDSLEKVAGIPKEKIVEVNGTFDTFNCLGCSRNYSLKCLKECIISDVVPKCEDCGETIKPEIVFSGEDLPRTFYERWKEDIQLCDLIIIIGSSLEFEEFESLFEKVDHGLLHNSPELLINRKKVAEPMIYWFLVGEARNNLPPGSYFYQPYGWYKNCDEGCQEFANLLGWDGELNMLIMRERMGLPIVKESKEESAQQEVKKS